MQSRAIPQTPLALSLCVLWAFACALAPADPAPTAQPALVPTPTPQPQHTLAQPAPTAHPSPIPTPTPQPSAALPAPSSATECVSSSDPNPTLIQPSPTPAATLAPLAPPSHPPSIEMRVVRSDAIVRARPPSVAGELRAIPSADAGVAPTCRPVAIFQFPITEYLMGGGGDELTVEWQFAGYHTYLTREDAQNALDWAISSIDVTLETRDAVIFLRSAQTQQAPASASPPTAAAYNFTRLWIDNFVHPIRNSWLPLADAGSNAAAQTDADLLYLLGPLPKYLLESDTDEESDSPPTISLAELRESVEAVVALMKAGEGIEGYKTCMTWRLDDENEFAHNPPELQEPFTDEISSGLIQRIPIHSSERGGGWQTSLGLVNWRAEGPDAEYFQIQVTDQWPALPRNDIDSDLAPVSYHQRYATTRPLPMGIYRFVPRPHDRDRWRICKHIPFDEWIPWEVTAVAPAGTLHEAFFDPVADGAAIAAGGSLGALNPATFTAADGAETTIRRVEWASNKATITLANPPASLAGHHAEFIAPDGSVALRLDFDDATSAATHDALALSWQVCAQPWRPGDLLMLRITKTRFDSGNSATHPTGC